MFKSDYEWKHDYVRLALDSGFCFERAKGAIFDKNKLSSVDTEQIMQERDFATLEKIIPCITNFVLDAEQAQILDPNFVKIFHLGQLCVQYLLFCAKYLDNSLISLKKEHVKVQEDNKELNLFVEDLKSHVNTLMKELEAKPTFRCTQCEKVFSSEDFLNSHIKRRHSVASTLETEKLELEIKELKGRLNSAERRIHRESDNETSVLKEMEMRKIEELQQKFDDLKVLVQSELKILQSQNNLEKKYENLLEKITVWSSVGQRRESTTQTDVARNEEVLDRKVTSSFQKIESQMETFWRKLDEMEKYKNENVVARTSTRKSKEDKENSFKTKKSGKKTNSPLKEKIDSIVEVKSKEEELKPVPATRSFKKNVVEEEKEEDSTQISMLKEEIVGEFKKPKIVEVNKEMWKKNVEEEKEESTESSIVELKEDRIVEFKKSKILEEKVMNLDTSSTDSDSSYSSKSVEVKPVLPTKRQNIRLETKEDKVTEEMLKRFKLQIERNINKKLQELGVSPDWKTLPTKSYERALEIVKHQAGLIKRGYPQFDYISSQIEKNITEKLDDKGQKLKVKPQTRKIEIKNRKMYETDSESEAQNPYKAVINELKEERKLEGVLKSYPSIASLTKKKVLFNLSSENMKDGGSSTSIASSVLDPTPRKDIENLSDFDFSDM